MKFVVKLSAVLAPFAIVLFPFAAPAQPAQFNSTFIETAEYCISSTDDECQELVLNNISTVRGATQGEQYDSELSAFAAAIADEWDDGMSQSACERLADALVAISESVESDSLASNIILLATVVRDCEGIGILADELLASQS